jgi:hypothetical protein
MAKGKKPPPPPKTKVVLDMAQTMPGTYANADARFARVSPDTAMALDYAIDRILEIEAVNPFHAFRSPEENIRETIFMATRDAFDKLFAVRYGVHVLTRQEMSSQ